MPETGLERTPLVVKGAFVQIVKNMVGFIPNIVVFQYNPDRLSHSLTPWNPFETDQTQRGAQAPTVQPFNPRETFSLSIELDVTDDLADGNPIAVVSGIADRLAALRDARDQRDLLVEGDARQPAVQHLVGDVQRAGARRHQAAEQVAGGGAVGGFLLDRAVKRTVLVYSSTRRVPTVRIVPLLLPRHAGVNLIFEF